MADQSLILGTNGKPLQKAQALKEQQTDEARISALMREHEEHPSRGLTPARLHRILESAEQGDLKAQHELFTDMEEKDAQIGSDLAKRRQMAAELEWQIVPPDNASAAEKKATEFCIEVFRGLDVEDLIIDLGSAIGHGWVNLENRWSKDGQHRIIEQPQFRPHAWFQLHSIYRNHITLRNNSMDGEALWPLGWVQHKHKARSGYVARSGLHRVLVWPYLFQNYALGDLAELLDIYGIPARLGTYPRGASDKEKATLLQAVTMLGHRAAGIIPQGMQIDFKDAANGKGDLFKVMLDWCERAKAKAILGGTLTSGTGEGTNTNALGNVHERGLMSLIRSDVRQYASTIKRDILWPLVAINFGIDDLRRVPMFYLDTKEIADLKVLSEVLPVFTKMADIPAWWFYEKSGIPKPTAEDELLKAAEPSGFGVMKKQMAALKAETRSDNQSPAEIIAEQLASETQQGMAEWLAHIEAMLETAQSLEEFQAMLTAAYDELDTAALGTPMEHAFTAAHAAGRFDIEQSGAD